MMIDDKYLALRRLQSSHIIKEREHEIREFRQTKAVTDFD